jgi:hypothetical protein
MPGWLQRVNQNFLWSLGQCRTMADSPSKSYSKTLLLPKTSFALHNAGAKREEKYRLKTCDDLYQWQVRVNQGLYKLEAGTLHSRNI